MPKTFSKEELETQYQRLPPVLQDALFNPDIAAKIFAVGKEVNLTIEEIGFLAEEVGYLILGLTHPKEFTNRLSGRIDIEKETIQKIASEVNTRIFFPLREELKNTHDMDIGTVETEKPRMPIPPLVSVAEKLPQKEEWVIPPPLPTTPPPPPTPAVIPPQVREMPPPKISFQKLQKEIKSIPLPKSPTRKIEEVLQSQKPTEETSGFPAEELELELEIEKTPQKEEKTQPLPVEPSPVQPTPKPLKSPLSPALTLRLPPGAAKNELAEDYYRARPESMRGGGVFAEPTTPKKPLSPKPFKTPSAATPRTDELPPSESKIKPYEDIDPYREPVE